jgi:hypothetical protein
MLMDGHDTGKGDRKLVDSMMMSWAEQGIKITPGGAHWLSPWGRIATRPTLPASPFWRRARP